MPTEGQKIFASQFLWLLSHLSHNKLLKEKKEFLLLQAKSEGKSTGPMKVHKVLGLWSFVNQQQHQFGRGKKGFGLHPVLCRSSCQNTFGERQKGGREGGRKRKAFLQICNCYPNPNIRQAYPSHYAQTVCDYRHFFPSFHSATWETSSVQV